MFKKAYQKLLATAMAGLTAGSLSLAKPNIVIAQEKPNKLEETLKKVQVSTAFGVQSKYTSASGKILVDNLIYVPSVNFSLGNFNALVLGMQDANTKEWIEGDYIFEYGKNIKNLGNVTLGYGYYDIPSSPDTHEVFGKLRLNLPLNPEFRVYHDFGTANGQFMQFGIGHELKIGKQPIVLGANVGYNRHYTVEDSGFSNVSGYIGIPIKPVKGTNLTITPSLTLSKALDHKFDDFANFGLEVRFGF